MDFTGVWTFVHTIILPTDIIVKTGPKTGSLLGVVQPQSNPSHGPCRDVEVDEQSSRVSCQKNISK